MSWMSTQTYGLIYSHNNLSVKLTVGSIIKYTVSKIKIIKLKDTTQDSKSFTQLFWDACSFIDQFVYDNMHITAINPTYLT